MNNILELVTNITAFIYNTCYYFYRFYLCPNEYSDIAWDMKTRDARITVLNLLEDLQPDVVQCSHIGGAFIPIFLLYKDKKRLGIFRFSKKKVIFEHAQTNNELLYTRLKICHNTRQNDS